MGELSLKNFAVAIVISFWVVGLSLFSFSRIEHEAGSELTLSQSQVEEYMTAGELDLRQISDARLFAWDDTGTFSVPAEGDILLLKKIFMTRPFPKETREGILFLVYGEPERIVDLRHIGLLPPEKSIGQQNLISGGIRTYLSEHLVLPAEEKDPVRKRVFDAMRKAIGRSLRLTRYCYTWDSGPVLLEEKNGIFLVPDNSSRRYYFRNGYVVRAGASLVEPLPLFKVWVGDLGGFYFAGVVQTLFELSSGFGPAVLVIVTGSQGKLRKVEIKASPPYTHIADAVVEKLKNQELSGDETGAEGFFLRKELMNARRIAGEAFQVFNEALALAERRKNVIIRKN